jgi:hypothetical protein
MCKIAICTLGANGDVMNALPIALHEFQQGNHVTFIISKEFASLLDGVSYVEREVWDGPYHECIRAAEWAEQSGRFDKVLVAQCYGTSIERQTDSYCKEAWRAVGKLHLWGKLPLVFDNRDKERESGWVKFVRERLGNGNTNIIIVSHSGKSSPFPHSEALDDLLKQFESTCLIIGISYLKCERFYDLLGLMEIATCLIATDSGPLHLANAVPKLSVIALITDRPDMWHGSPPQPNHVLRIRYGDFEKSKGRIVETLNQIVSKDKIERRIVHAWNDYSYRQPDAQWRHEIAKRSWEEEYKRGRWIPCPVYDAQLARDARSIGEPKPLPFVNDIIEAAASQAQPDDYICLTNDDTIFVHGLTDLILNGPMQWSSRWEHVTVKESLTPETIQKNAWKHVGADIFVFTKRWWLEVRSEFPDMILAREAWDLVLRTLINLKGGKESIALCAHIIHQPEWHSPENRESVSNLFNRDAARRFFREHSMRWPQV